MNVKIDYRKVLDEHVTALEGEAERDLKMFYNQSEGTARALETIDVLDAARKRLQVFVRA